MYSSYFYIFSIFPFCFFFHSQLISFIFFLSPFFPVQNIAVYIILFPLSLYILFFHVFLHFPSFCNYFLHFLYFLFNLTACCLIHIRSGFRTYLALLVTFPLGMLRRAKHSEYCLIAFGSTSLLYSNTLPWQQHAEDFRSHRNLQFPRWNFCNWHI